MSPRLLHHIHLPSPIHYATACKIQDTIVRHYLDVKARSDGLLLPTTTTQDRANLPLRPTILTMEMQPVYTRGRRDRGKPKDGLEFPSGAEVIDSLRGGQTTFHGPGQLTAYPILDLAALQIRPRCYIHTLESCIIQTLAQFDIAARRTGNTGVWTSEDAKIAAIGVHLRRNISSHGLALNVSTDLSHFDRIVACGLADKRATSMQQEGSPATVLQVTERLVGILAEALNLDGVVAAQYREEEYQSPVTA